MKRIGIDARLYFQTGVGVYLRNLLHYLQSENTDDLEFYIYILKKDQDKIRFNNKRFIPIVVPFRWHSLGEQIGFAQRLVHDKLDLAHFTYFSYPVIYKKPFIATIHDITPLLFKTGKASTKNPVLYELKHAVFRYILGSQIKQGKHVITPTETVKKQLVQTFGSRYEDKISFFYEGLNREFENIKESTSLKNKVGTDFFLYVGNFYPHKNIERLINGFSKTNLPEKLILVGPKDFFSSRIESLIKSKNLTDHILLVHGADIPNLAYLYSHAKALISASLSEGFGLPIIEAMHFNLPIIASNIPVFKELLGQHYTSFNETAENDICRAILQFHHEPKKYDYRRLVRRYSFQKMTKQTLDIYKKYV